MTTFPISFVDPEEGDVEILPIGLGGQSTDDFVLVIAGEYTKSFGPTLNETPVVCSGLIDDECFVVGIRLVSKL